MIKTYRTIYSYLSLETLSSFLVAFAFFFFIFFVNQILLLAEDILSKKVPILDVIVLLVYYLPYIVSMAFPFSALVGALMTVGRLAADNEILAFRASGISLLRAFLPLLLLSLIFTGINFVFNDYFLPLGIIKSNMFYRQIIRNNPDLEFQPYTAKRYEDKSIITGDSRNNRLQDLVIIDTTAEKEKRVISAREAVLLENTDQEGVIALELHDVFSHVSGRENPGEYEYSRAERMIYNILLKDVVGNMVQFNPGPRGMSSVDLWKEIVEKRQKLNDRIVIQANKITRLAYELAMEIEYARTLTADTPGNVWERMESIKSMHETLVREQKVSITDKTLRNYLLEFHRKFSHPFACIVFIIFAFPVGLYARKSGKLVGFAIGVIMAGIYWGLLFVAIRMGAWLDISSFFMMWLPNFIVLAAGLVIFMVRLKR